MNVELTIKGEVEVLRLKPGDVVVITLNGDISAEGADELRRGLMERIFPNNEVLMVGAGATLSVQRPEP